MWKPGTDRPHDKTPHGVNENDAASTQGNDPPSQIATKVPAKFVLSQKTLAMKFMQRRKTSGVKRVTAVQEQHKQDTWKSVPEDDKQANDDSKLVCTRDVPDPSLPLLFGRRSFGRFNKGVEDELREASKALRFAASEETELREEVSAEEMTARMLKYTGLSRRSGKNDSGRRPNCNKRQRR